MDFIERIFTDFSEIHGDRAFGDDDAVACGMARLNGEEVLVIGNRKGGTTKERVKRNFGMPNPEGYRKALRLMHYAVRFGLPIVTFVDTPGFEPGRDLEWRGMIRHGAELVHAYSAATVPRICVVLRKAYGGAYIVMDSRGIGNDLCVAWPSAEIAVMGAPGAVAILNKGRSDEELVTEFREAFENPYRAAERGLVDAVIDPIDTRRVLVDALRVLVEKRDSRPPRRHSNTPL
jgi:acetyl-CoA carboxylase carboxyltransferase component